MMLWSTFRPDGVRPGAPGHYPAHHFFPSAGIHL